MDDTIRNIALTLLTGAAKKILIVAGTALATHGWISGSQTETFVSLGLAAIPLAVSFWQDYGKAIVLSQLEVLKAKSLAQAAKLKDAGLPQVTVGQIAAQSEVLTPASVTKVIAKLPAPIQDNVAPETKTDTAA